MTNYDQMLKDIDKGFYVEEQGYENRPTTYALVRQTLEGLTEISHYVSRKVAYKLKKETGVDIVKRDKIGIDCSMSIPHLTGFKCSV